MLVMYWMAVRGDVEHKKLRRQYSEIPFSGSESYQTITKVVIRSAMAEPTTGKYCLYCNNINGQIHSKRMFRTQSQHLRLIGFNSAFGIYKQRF